jgi:hypothetical protein
MVNKYEVNDEDKSLQSEKMTQMCQVCQVLISFSSDEL